MSRKPWVLSCRNNRCDITQRSLLVCGNVALQGCMKNVVLPTSGTVFKSPSKRLVLSPFPGLFLYTLQGINMSHLGKRKIIFKMPFCGGYVSSLEGNHKLHEYWWISMHLSLSLSLYIIIYDMRAPKISPWNLGQHTPWKPQYFSPKSYYESITHLQYLI